MVSRNIVISLFFIMILMSCTTTKYVEKEIPMETVRTEYINSIKYDSIYVHDSINTYIKGDTVFKDKVKTFYKEKLRVDTITITDSIPYPVRIKETVTKEVNTLTWYQKCLNFLGIISLIFIIGKVCIKRK